MAARTRLTVRPGALDQHRSAGRATSTWNADKTDVLRAYLKRWKAKVGPFFDGVDGNSDDEEIRAIAAKRPVFVLAAATP